jgi:esterase/lipase
MIHYFANMLSRRLMAWSAASALVGVWLLAGVSPVQQGLGVQMLVWAAIDGLIALFGWRSSGRKLFDPVDFAAVQREAVKLRRILWVNFGLDWLYLAGGLSLLLTRGQTDPFLWGTGLGILIQAGFLLLFDVFHALKVPEEIQLPDWGLYRGEKYADFRLGSGERAVLMLHGYPGSPQEMRALAEAVAGRGWVVQGITLPGQGRDIQRLFQARADEWLEAARAALNELQAEYSTVVLVGFSMGGGMAVRLAAEHRPAAVALLAPFWFAPNRLLTVLYTLIRPFLPTAFPLRGIIRRSDPAVLLQPAQDLLSELQVDAETVWSELSALRIPTLILEQFGRVSQWVQQYSPQVQGPVLLVQGKHDPVVRMASAQKLVARLPGPVTFVEVDGAHEITLAGHAGFDATAEALLQFLRRFDE